MNTLYYGEMSEPGAIATGFRSVDLIYLDPPFNSNRKHKVLFKDESGLEADSQIMAFEDTWHWHGAAPTYDDLIPRQATRFRKCSRLFGAALKGKIQ